MNEKLCESCAGFAHNEECCTDESQATMVEGVLMGLHRKADDPACRHWTPDDGYCSRGNPNGDRKAGLYCVECRGM